MLSLLLQACIENPRNQLPVLLVECQLLSNDQTLENMALLIQVKKMIYFIIFNLYLSFVPGKVHLRGSEESRMATQLPALSVESSGKIFIKTMSWIEVIRRRHGFVDKNGTI